MKDKKINIWNDSIYGLVFSGREVDLKAPARYIDKESNLIVFRLPHTGGGGITIF